jgi:hypothetical protein
MTARRLVRPALVLLVVVSVLAQAPASALGRTAVDVSVDRTDVKVRLGESFGFRSTITNTGSAPLSGLVAHLNVVGLDEDIYVDPEDWSEDRTRFLPPLPPGQSTELSWTVKAVTGGKAAIYVVVLPRSAGASPETPAVGPEINVAITERRTLNSGGVLPLALGVPAALGLLTLGLRRRPARPPKTPG